MPRSATCEPDCGLLYGFCEDQYQLAPETYCCCADHVVFASDCPFDKEKGPGYIRDTIKVLNSLALSNAEREKICWRNAVKLFGLRQ